MKVNGGFLICQMFDKIQILLLRTFWKNINFIYLQMKTAY